MTETSSSKVDIPDGGGGGGAMNDCCCDGAIGTLIPRQQAYGASPNERTPYSLIANFFGSKLRYPKTPTTTSDPAVLMASHYKHSSFDIKDKGAS
jgi:hypothetical protein